VDTLQPLHHRPASVLHGQLSVYSDSRIVVIPSARRPGTIRGRGTQVSELAPSLDPSPRNPQWQSMDRTEVVCSEWRSKVEPLLVPAARTSRIRG
jgi:hypothetical protein